MTRDKLLDTDTVLTSDEISQLQTLCYDYGNSACPFDSFYNDIRNNTNPKYNQNQAYKDLWLILLEFIRLVEFKRFAEKKLAKFANSFIFY